MKTIINTKNAPAPIGPYSQAVAINGLLYVSGQIPMDPVTGEIINTGIVDEARQVMENLKGILTEVGAGFDDIIKTTIFLTDMQTFTQVNDVYGSYFASNFPARETVQVSGLPKGVNVEISVIAAKS